MFLSREASGAGAVEVAFTDRHGGGSTGPFHSLDLSRSRPGRDDELAANLDRVAAAFGVDGFATMRQVHGADVCVVERPGRTDGPSDGLVTTTPGLGLCVRVGDCVPVLLADSTARIVAAAHVGRRGLVAGVVHRTVQAMGDLGANRLEAWVGPYVCGGCYEVPAAMREDVADVVPAAYACTTGGTPSVDVGAGVQAQLEAAGCRVHDRSRCTVESGDLYSYRRDGALSGRFAGLIVLRQPTGV